ncbi:MAG: hypothetical protein LBT46_02880, partial [Planctomycetaceae bacterium]|nr:hypothetical protein [Planctomycetaceae bacterium]
MTTAIESASVSGIIHTTIISDIDFYKIYLFYICFSMNSVYSYGRDTVDGHLWVQQESPMSRLLFSTINVLSLFSLCAAVQGEVNPNTRAANKALYSTRPGQVRSAVPYYYYGTPTAPRFSQPQFFVPPPEPAGLSTQAVPLQAVAKTKPAIPPAPPLENAVAVQPPAPVTAPVPPVINVEKSIEKTIVIRDEEPKVSTDDEMDALNARLAKIQLERHNLTHALNLVKKIKSQEFLAKTVVDLAEYVSRDPNYRAESDKLYGLAVAAIESIRRGTLVNISVEGTNNAASAAEVQVQPPAVQQPVVQPETKPAVQPAAEKPKPVPVIIEDGDTPDDKPDVPAKEPDKPAVKAPDDKPDVPAKEPDKPAPWNGSIGSVQSPPDTSPPQPPATVTP